MKLAESIVLPCGARLKNRLAKAAMTEGLADALNRATSRHVTLYKRWARGGAGLLLTGNVMVDRRYLERPGNVSIDGPQSNEAMAALSAYAAAAVENGADIWMQISHAGRQSPKIVATEPVGPSAVAVKLPGGQFATPKALSGDEIENVVERFAHVASTAKSAGFSGVQIHGAHGYLISEFLNPLVNQRTDEWGGSIDNRMRLLIRTIEAVRAKVGSGFPVSVKLNSSDFQQGGFSFDDCLVVVERLNDVGVDLLEISGGNYEQPRMMGIEGMEPAFEEPMRASTRAREAYFIRYAEEVAKIANAPLMVTGGFRRTEAMVDALTTGAADVIGVGRPLCVDADAPQRLLSGEWDQLPKWEQALRLGPGVLGPQSKIDLVKALNGFGGMAFYYQNIFRLADGLEPKRTMALLPAFVKHQMAEAKAGRALQGRSAPAAG